MAIRSVKNTHNAQILKVSPLKGVLHFKVSNRLHYFPPEKDISLLEGATLLICDKEMLKKIALWQGNLQRQLTQTLGSSLTLDLLPGSLYGTKVDPLHG